MIFFPYERFIIQTRFTPDQVRQKMSLLMEKMDASLSWAPLTANKVYGDTVEEYRFQTRSVSFSSRHRSTIKGKVSCKMGIVQIEFTMLPDAYVFFFTIATFGFLGFIWVASLVSWVSSIGTPNLVFPKDVLGIGGALVLGYAIFVRTVKFEAREIEKFLRAAFGITGG